MMINIKTAKDKLRWGELIALPTDTVYGIAADMYNEEAILRLYNLKRRASQKPMVIQLASASDITDFIGLIPYDLEKLTQRFWPGALTIVLPIKEDKVPPILRANFPTAAFRVSKNNSTRELISEYGPLVMTSANPSGQAELANQKEIESVFGEKFPILETREHLASGIASTVLIYIDASWVILRKGEILLKELRQVLGYNPPVVSSIDYKEKSYVVDPQLYLMEKEYDGSIEVVVGFENRKYHGAQQVITIGTTDSPLKPKEAILKIMQTIQKEDYAHVWVDLNVPKIGFLKEIARILERSLEI